MEAVCYDSERQAHPCVLDIRGLHFLWHCMTSLKTLVEQKAEARAVAPQPSAAVATTLTLG